MSHGIQRRARFICALMLAAPVAFGGTLTSISLNGTVTARVANIPFASITATTSCSNSSSTGNTRCGGSSTVTDGTNGSVTANVFGDATASPGQLSFFSRLTGDATQPAFLSNNTSEYVLQENAGGSFDLPLG